MDGLVLPTREGTCDELVRYALVRLKVGASQEKAAQLLELCPEDAATFELALCQLAAVLTT